jgi:hypothetical protein
VIVAGGLALPSIESVIVVFDGSSWSAADIPGSPGQVTGITRIGNGLVAVGNGLPDLRQGFIWGSDDGRTWHVVEMIENAAIYGLVTGDGVAVAVGARLDAEMNATAAAWFSSEGATWEAARVAAPAGSSMGTVASMPDGFMATGDRPLGMARPVWSATARPLGASWASLDNDLSDQLLPGDLVHSSAGMALAGATGRSGDQHPFVAFSADGGRWDLHRLSEAEGYASAVAEVNGSPVVAGVDADRLTLWSRNGDAWVAEIIEATGAGISALAWHDRWGLVAVGTRDGRHSVWVLGD